MNWYKILVVFWGVMIYFPLALYAQDIQGEQGNLCPPQQFQLVGPREVKTNISTQYQIISQEALSGSYEYAYEIWFSGQNVALIQDTVLTYAFPNSGTTVIKRIATTTGDCVYSLEEPISVYDSIITYIGVDSPELEITVEKMQDETQLFKKIPLGDTNISPDELLSQRYYIQHADTLLINSYQLGSILEQLDMLNQFAPIDMTSMQVYTISKMNQSAFRRLAARYHNLLNTADINVVPSQYLGSLISDLFLGKDVLEQPYVRTFSASLNNGNSWMIISYFIDFLLFHGFPLTTLTLILLLPLLALLISIFRQVIGFSVFGVFNPLLFAISLHVLGVTPTVILFVTSLFATGIMRMITQKLYLLYSAKVSLLIVIYVACLIFFVRVDYRFLGQQINFVDFQEINVLFPVLFMLTIGNQTFSEKFYLFDAGWWIGLLEFLFVSYIIYVAFTTVWLQNLFLGYPELLFLVLILNVVVGRFSGLQLIEYIRFMPLIKQYFRDEEEE